MSEKCMLVTSFGHNQKAEIFCVVLLHETKKNYFIFVVL